MKTSDLFLKLFGWLSISLVVAYLIDNVMIVGFNLPGAFSIFINFELYCYTSNFNKILTKLKKCTMCLYKTLLTIINQVYKFFLLQDLY